MLTETWFEKRADFWWEWPYKRGTTVSCSGKNMTVNAIFSLLSKCNTLFVVFTQVLYIFLYYFFVNVLQAQKNGYDGPVLGVKEADSNPRNFSEEKMKAGATVIGLQAGTNKVASQAGMNFGKSRSIID